MKAILVVLGLLLVLPGLAGATNEVVLGTSILPPNQSERNGRLDGRCVEIMNCVFRRLDRDWRGRILAWPRARVQMEAGELDGFFTGIPDAGAEQYARPSVPLALEKWYWFAARETLFMRAEFPEGVRIGVLRDSTTLLWLQNRNIEPHTVVSSPQQLIKLLATGRIDAYLSDIRVARRAARKLETTLEGFARRFYQYMPLVAWFSRDFLETEPGFLEAFNARVNHCIGDTFRMAPRERRQLEALARERIRPWIRARIRRELARINRQRQSLEPAEVRQLDERWRAETRREQSALIASIRDTWLSAFLRRKQAASNGLFHEIMITDRNGLNAGISHVTSDYWQGDERKFTRLDPAGKPEPVVDDIRFDASTRRFLAHVSLPIQDPASGEFLGAIIAGVDLQQALRADPR